MELGNEMEGIEEDTVYLQEVSKTVICELAVFAVQIHVDFFA